MLPIFMRSDSRIMRIMAIDYGDSRTGIACCDRSELISTPYPQIYEKGIHKVVDAVVNRIEELKPELIVIGLPKNMNGSEGERAEKTRKFGSLLSEKTDLEIVFWDERGTTITATYYMNETNTRGKKRKAILDSASAVVILDNYLQYRKNSAG